MRKIFAAVLASLVMAAGLGVTHAYASNTNSQDCLGPNNYLYSPSVTSTEDGTTIYTSVGYACWWNSPNNKYTVVIDVHHSENSNGFTVFSAYDCGSIWLSGAWQGGNCIQAYVNTSYNSQLNFGAAWSDSYFTYNANIPPNTGFATRDRNGTAATIVQPPGDAQEFPYVENWNDR